MTEDEALGPGNIAYIASTVADGTATPDDARRLLAEFVRQARSGTVEPRLIEHARDCFAAHLAGATLDHAFGIPRGRGHPAIDDDTRALVAMQVLEARLAGKSREMAQGEVADARYDAGLPIHGETQVRDAWKTHRVTGLVWLRALRAVNKCEWTGAELKRLRTIYKGVPDAKFPAEKSANTPP